MRLNQIKVLGVERPHPRIAIGRFEERRQVRIAVGAPEAQKTLSALIANQPPAVRVGDGLGAVNARCLAGDGLRSKIGQNLIDRWIRGIGRNVRRSEIDGKIGRNRQRVRQDAGGIDPRIEDAAGAQLRDRRVASLAGQDLDQTRPRRPAKNLLKNVNSINTIVKDAHA